MAWFESHLNSGGGGGGDTPIEFTKTSVIDKTQLPNIVFNEDYTNYDLLLFVCSNSYDGITSEFLTTSDMITEIFTYSYNGYGTFIMFNKCGGNHYITYKKNSNSSWTKNANRYLEITDVCSVTCNKTITKTDIYKRGSLGNTTVTITTQDNILDNDLLIMSCTNGYGDGTNVCDTIVNLKDTTTLFNNYIGSWARYNVGITQAYISEHTITAGNYFMCQGLKFS